VIDTIWETFTSPDVPMGVDGLDADAGKALLYRSPSATAHGSAHGVATHFGPPHEGEVRRSVPAPIAETAFVLLGVFNCVCAAHRALIILYGWEVASWDRVAQEAGQHFVQFFA
jgi:hypothetical protein